MKLKLLALIGGLLLSALAQVADAQTVTIRVNRADGTPCLPTQTGIISSFSCETGNDGGAAAPDPMVLGQPVALNDDAIDLPLLTDCSAGTGPYDREIQFSATSGVTGFAVLLADADFGADGILSIIGLTPSTPYFFKGVCIGADARRSVESNVVTATTLAPPDPPGDVTAPTTPTNVNCTSTIAFQNDCTWTAPTDAVGVTIIQVNRGLGDGAGNPDGAGAVIAMLTGTPPVSTFSDFGVTEDQQYFYRFSGHDAAGNIGTKSAHEYVTTVGTPDPPPPGDSDTPDYADPIAGVVIGARTTVPVANNAALAAALTAVNCGEILSLNGGTYATGQTYNKTCAANVAITIKCDVGETCTFTNSFTMSGVRGILTGLLFSGAAAKVTCSGTNNHVIANEFTGWTNGNAVTVNGTQCEVAYNEFHDPGAYLPGTNGGGAGQRIGIRTDASPGSPWIVRNYFHDFPEKPIPTNYSSGQSDAIEICQTGADGAAVSGAYLEYNLVEDHLQGGGTGAGTIDWKCGGGVARGNTFLNSPGRHDARMATNPIIFEGNWHDNNSGGMEIRGNSHVAVGNRIRGSGIRVMAGNVECTAAANNTRERSCNGRFEGNDSPLKIGHQYTGENLPALNSTIRGHVGVITCGVHQGTTGACGSASIPTPTYDFVFAVPLDSGDVGPAALAASTAAYRAARGL